MRTEKKQKHLWSVIYSTVLVLFTVYVLLDTFVIEHVYKTVEDTGSASITEAMDMTETEKAEGGRSEPVTTDSSYKDDNIQITVTEYKQYNSSVYVADVMISDIGYLKTAFANNLYGKNITEITSSIAADNNAILAINGDFYGARNSGYVLRNGKLYREKAAAADQEDLLITNDGSFKIITEGELTADDPEESGALQIFSFGPSLINNSLQIKSQ